MSRKIEFAPLMEFIGEIGALREMFPEIARELDNCLFEVLNNHTPKCGHGTCSCQTMTADQFHAERNLKFGITKSKKVAVYDDAHEGTENYEFN